MATSPVSLQEAVSLLSAGDQVVVSGNMNMSPMALIRELIRQGKDALSLLCASSAAVNADLLLGAGVVDKIEFPHVALGEYGAAPHFRKALEQGTVVYKDHA